LSKSRNFFIFYRLRSIVTVYNLGNNNPFIYKGFQGIFKNNIFATIQAWRRFILYTYGI